jgi:hypothetical protein
MMVRERCWQRKKLRSDVELRASDDRWCEPCFRKNEEELREIRRRAGDNTTENPSAVCAAQSAVQDESHNDQQQEQQLSTADDISRRRSIIDQLQSAI